VHSIEAEPPATHSAQYAVMPGGVNETNQRIAGTGHGGASGSWTEDSNTGCFCRGKWVSHIFLLIFEPDGWKAAYILNK
jgi:hypothetical protein